MSNSINQTDATEIYVLFPEYVDAGRAASVLYLKTFSMLEEYMIPQGIEEIIDVVSFFRYDKDLTWYYDGKNVDGLYYPNDIMDEYPFVDSIVRSAISAFGLLDWRVSKDFESKIVWNGNEIFNDTLGLVHSQSPINTPHSLVHATIISSNEAMMLVNEKINFLDSAGNTCCMSVQTSLSALYEWICVNRLPQRHFDVCDKHGENGVGQRMLPDGSYAAPLLCYRTHAQALLEKAIGLEGDLDLWYYDEQYKAFIYFEYQNNTPQNAYHGYHLKRGDKGFEKINIEKLSKVQGNVS